MSTTHFPNAAPLGTVIPFPRHLEQRGEKLEARLRLFESSVAVAERGMDFVVVAATILGMWKLAGPWQGTGGAGYSGNVLAITAACALLMVLLLEKNGGYRPCMSLLAVRETERLLKATVIGTLVALPVLLAVTSDVPRIVLLGPVFLIPVTLAAEKWCMQRVARRLRSRIGLTRKSVIVGTGTTARRIFSALARSPKLGIDPVAFVNPQSARDEPVIFEASYRRQRQARVLCEPVTAKLMRRLGATVLILADATMTAGELAAMKSEAFYAGASVYVLPEQFANEGISTEHVELDGLVLAYQLKPRGRFWFEWLKRLVDIAVATISLVLLSPLMLLAAIGIHSTSEGPIVFRQKRAGLGGEQFEMYKFRTMYVDSERYARSPVSRNDRRITPLGKLLRHTCIDELPQLFNVLRGDMSLVGPRPEMPFIVEEYEAIHRKRLEVKPGITGLWQLSGDRRAPIHENISYDLYYVRNRNLFMDFAILLHTAVFAFRGV
jgi:exopolysaccharide biosynthesis polyprenyl glycosylphosphotransferase